MPWLSANLFAGLEDPYASDPKQEHNQVKTNFQLFRLCLILTFA